MLFVNIIRIFALQFIYAIKNVSVSGVHSNIFCYYYERYYCCALIFCHCKLQLEREYSIFNAFFLVHFSLIQKIPTIRLLPLRASRPFLVVACRRAGAERAYFNIITELALLQVVQYRTVDTCTSSTVASFQDFQSTINNNFLTLRYYR